MKSDDNGLILEGIIPRLKGRIREIDDQIAELEGRLTALNIQKDSLIKGIDTIEEASQFISELPPELLLAKRELNSRDGENQETQFERIASFLRGQGNRPCTIAEIEMGTNIPRSSISAVLYRTHPEHFGSIERQGVNRAKGWYMNGPAELNSASQTGFSTDEDIPF